jgi:hypothetical protein
MQLPEKYKENFAEWRQVIASLSTVTEVLLLA